MPLTNFPSLPANARVWVFACDRSLVREEARPLLDQVDAYLAQWTAHGAPLRCARDWRHDRFLAIGIDPTAEQASGCSIDDLFRRLRAAGDSIGVRVLGGGQVFYRDEKGSVQSASRVEFAEMAVRGDVTEGTPIFDTSVITADDWRERFERPTGDAWTAELLPTS
ncbi:MAG: hypothetical protein WBQ26_12310 [Gemmatimonadaceae bacterium]